jgi:hypothetical protein
MARWANPAATIAQAMEGWGRTRWLGLSTVVAALCVAAPAAGQETGVGGYGIGGGYEPGAGGDEGYDGDGGGGSDDYPDGSGAGSGRVELTLSAKQRQKSLKAVKARASCGTRACLLDAQATLKAGKKRKARLKPVEDMAIAGGDTERLRLKFTKKAAKLARWASRHEVKPKVKISASARGVGGGGRDSAKRNVRLKPKSG